MRYAGGYELRYSARGYPYRVWKKPVPRISDDILDSVVYLYPSVTDAEAGEKAGGTGFLVGVPSGVHEGVTYQYAVTNRHVTSGRKFSRYQTQHARWGYRRSEAE